MPLVDALLGRISNLPIPFVKHQGGDANQANPTSRGFDDLIQERDDISSKPQFMDYAARQRLQADNFYLEQRQFDRASLDERLTKIDDYDRDADRRDIRETDARDIDETARDEETNREEYSGSDEQDEQSTSTQNQDTGVSDDDRKSTAKDGDSSKGRLKNGAATAQVHANENALLNANPSSALKTDLTDTRSTVDAVTDPDEPIVAAQLNGTANEVNTGDPETVIDEALIVDAVNAGDAAGTTDDNTNNDAANTNTSNSDNGASGNGFDALLNVADGTAANIASDGPGKTQQDAAAVSIDPNALPTTVTGTSGSLDPNAVVEELPGLAREVQGIWTWRAPWLQLPGITALSVGGQNINLTAASAGSGTTTGPGNAQGSPVQAALANLVSAGGASDPTAGQGSGNGLDSFGQQVAAQAKQMGQGASDDGTLTQAANRQNFQAALNGKGPDGGQTNSTNAASNSSATQGDALQSADTSSATSRSQTAQAMQAASHRAATGSNANIQVAFHIAKAVQDGNSKISIRLDPPEMGRVDVRLEVGADGKVTANVTSDRQDTLDLMQRDAKDLEKALNDAGLDANMEDLTFSLQDQDNDDDQNGSNNNMAKADQDNTDSAGTDANRLPWIDPRRALDVSI